MTLPKEHVTQLSDYLDDQFPATRGNIRLTVMLDEIGELITTLVAENKRLRADRDRLDWLETQSADIETDSNGELLYTHCFSYPIISDDGSETLRQAIDAARTAEKGQTP